MTRDFREIFLHANRPAEKLQAAICYWLNEPDRTSPPFLSCEKYLRMRIRPAVQALLRCDAVEAVDALAQAGLFGEKETSFFLKDAARNRTSFSSLYLLHLGQSFRNGHKALFSPGDDSSVPFESRAADRLFQQLADVLQISEASPDTGTGGAGHQGSPDGAGHRGAASGSGEETYPMRDLLKQQQYSPKDAYHRILYQFMETEEILEMDPESYDLISYMAGLSMQNRLFLTEPLEYREVCRLKTLVIAIDTSASCKTETVQRFLLETWKILSGRENFSEDIYVCLIQCDSAVQHVDVLRTREDFRQMIQNITIKGRAGTDFRPVFRYVHEEQKAGRLRDLKALFYFTDGDGVYPEHPPDYETFFLFLEKNKYISLVPSWAHLLITGDLT